MGTAIAVPDSPPRDHLYTIYAATRTGGLWKTTNNGITWAAISDSVDVPAVGAVAVAPSDSSVVWMGSGDQANARSSHSGDGIYKSTDAGKTWQHMGLRDSHHIARILIHPSNPNIVYVAAMGRLFSRNDERGVFRTRDGGKTWDKVLYVDDRTGAIDLAMHRKTPDVLYAAMYDKERTPWQLVPGGPGTGVYKSDDGGTKWRKLRGLPSGNVGRIGIDVNGRNPAVVTLIIENVNSRAADMPARVDACQASGGRGGGGRAGGPIGNEVYRSTDAGQTWKKTHGDDIDVAGSKAPYSFNQIKTNPADPAQIIVNSDTMYESRDGGKTWTCGFFRGVFGDFRTMWWDEQDPQRILLGSDGGVNVSYDGGRTSDYFLNMRVGEVYAIGVDMDDPYNIYAGLQDHDSWKGPSNGRSGQITLEDWTTVGTGDGMYNQVDPTNSRWVYNTFQTGGQRRTGLRHDWRDVTEAIATAGGLRDRYVSRVFASPHEVGTAFVAKNGFRNDDFKAYLYRTTDFGKTWTSIAANLAESPLNVIVQDRKNKDLLIVGNDLGVWVSVDAGQRWDRLRANLPTVPVHDLTIHPRENDLVLGTYGRGVFVGDITHLQEVSPSMLSKPAHLFVIEPRTPYGFRALGNYHLFGDAYIEVPNEPEAFVISYYLGAKDEKGARVTVTDIRGETVAQLKGPSEAGVNRVPWNMRHSGAPEGRGGRGAGPALPAGAYRVVIDVAGQQLSGVATIRERQFTKPY